MQEPKKYNSQIEALRGMAAITVFIHHLIILPGFNLGYDFRSHVVPYTPSGHLMVLLFFIMSGYVIGLTNPVGTLFKPLSYLKKRMLRIYPIYLVAVLLTWTLSQEDAGKALRILFFLQNIFVDNFLENQALWSLNHEMLYYLLAIPILYCCISPKHILLVLVLILAIHSLLYPLPALIEAYSVGFLFWMLGFWISRNEINWQATPNQLLSIFIFLWSQDFLNIITVFSKYIPWQHGPGKGLQGIVSCTDLLLLPVCLYAILHFTGTNKRLSKVLFFVVYGASLGHLGYLLLSGSFFKTSIFLLPALFLVSSLFLYYAKPFKVNFTLFGWLGSISYALYVIHTPIIFAFGRIPFGGGNTLFFFLRAVSVVLLVLFISVVLEKKYQPLARKLFTKNQR